MMKRLPLEQVAALHQAFKTAKKGREKVRYQALWLLTQGYTRAQVCKVQDLGSRTLAEWVLRYNKYGLESLRMKPQPGNYRQLTNEQKQQIKNLITHSSPEQLGLVGKFWNRVTLRQLVTSRFQVTYRSWESYRKLLHWCGFSFHKPNKVNQRRNPHLVRRFEDNLKKSSGGTEEKIVWYW
jgi:transposase